MTIRLLIQLNPTTKAFRLCKGLSSVLGIVCVRLNRFTITLKNPALLQFIMMTATTAKCYRKHCLSYHKVEGPILAITLEILHSKRHICKQVLQGRYLACLQRKIQRKQSQGMRQREEIKK